MKDGPAFQMYADLFYIDTAAWTIQEVGIYTRLLLCEWANGPLPTDEKRLARIAGTSTKSFQKWFSQIKSKFHLNEADLYINDKLEEVREKQRKYREAQAEKGKRGAEKRWNDEMAGAMATAMPGLQPDNGSSSSSSSSLNTKEINKEGEDSPFSLPSKEEIEQASEPMILSLVEKVSIQIHKEKIFPEVFAFRNKMIKQKKNLRSILHTLIRAYLKREFEEGPWPYCQKVIEIEDKKYNARDYGKTS